MKGVGILILFLLGIIAAQWIITAVIPSAIEKEKKMKETNPRGLFFIIFFGVFAIILIIAILAGQ